MTRPFALDPYAARSCELKTVYAFTPGLVAPERSVRLPAFFHDPDAVEAEVVDLIRRSPGTLADLRPLRGAPSAEQEEAALAALASGTDIVVGPLLPRDWDGHRAGRPSLLLRVADGYVPVLVKFHRVLESAPDDAEPLRYSTLAAPTLVRELPGRRFRWAGRLNAALQAAHLWRLLEATGHAASAPRAGLVGLERLPDPDAGTPRQDPVVTWLDLDAPWAAPDPASVAEPAAAPRVTALERYDAEHARRVGLAASAMEDGWTPPEPVLRRECPYCPWLPRCEARLPEDDLSRRISKAPLDVHELTTLRRMGIRSVSDLADADLDAFLPGYLPAVSHRDGGEERLRLAQRRARLIASGGELERTSTGPIELPAHDLEIDLDIETSADDRAYLWGFHVDDRATGRSSYRAFARFADLDASGERALAAEAFAWLRQVTAGRDAAVYHYSDYETLRIHRLAAGLADRGEAELAGWVAGLVAQRFVDLFPVVKAHFFGANGLGLKIVASAGAGFSWRDAAPGGLASQSWFADAVGAPTQQEREAAATRVLEYNEDDCRATWALRGWLRGLG